MKQCRNSAARSALAVFLNISFALSTFAAITLDNSFAGGGKLTISFPDSTSNYSSDGRRIFIQPNGRIVAAGTFTRATAEGQLGGVAVVGVTSGGTADPTFDLFQDWQSNGFTSVSDALMYPDGRTLLLTRFFNVVGSSTVRVTRLNADGSSDGAFNSNVIIGQGSGFGTARGAQIALRSDGKVLVLINDNSQFFLYRLNDNGTRDTTFGVNGVIAIQFNKISLPSEGGMQMLVLPDNKVVIVGLVPPSSPNASQFFLARLTESGGWDKTFGRVGFIRVPFGDGLNGSVTGALLQPDGKILLCGQVNGSDSDSWMARFNPNGRRDSTFGSGGIVISDFTPNGIDGGRAIALSADGRIRFLGTVSPSAFLVARYSAAGLLEDNTSFVFTQDYSVPQDITIQPDGKLVVIGTTKNPNSSINGGVFAIARLTE